MDEEVITNQVNQNVPADPNAPATPAEGTTAGLNAAGTATATNVAGEANTAVTNQAQAQYPNGINTEYLNNYMNTLGGGVDHSQDITQMYQGLLDSNLAQLEAANQINQSNYQANQDQLQEYYNQQRNAAAAEYERQRYNQNLQAQMNGLNVGTGSQMSLALGNQYQANQTALGKAQMQAQAEIDRAIANLNVQYQADVAAAIGQNDYQKAAALYQDKLDREKQMTQYYQMLLSEMNTRASYGDFAMMRQIYGDDAANMAKEVWARQNPDAAYAQGNITAQEYYNITGVYPRGYKGAGSSGGSYHGREANRAVYENGTMTKYYTYTSSNRWDEYTLDPTTNTYTKTDSGVKGNELPSNAVRKGQT